MQVNDLKIMLADLIIDNADLRKEIEELKRKLEATRKVPADGRLFEKSVELGIMEGANEHQ